MMRSTSAMRFPKSKWTEQETDGYHGNEAGLQQYLEESCVMRHIEHRRITDSIWSFIKTVASASVTKCLAHYWKDKPDLLMMIPVSDKFSLACEIELKSHKGKLTHGQRDYAKRMPVHLCRSPRQIDEVLAEFREFACELEKMSTQEGG